MCNHIFDERACGHHYYVIVGEPCEEYRRTKKQCELNVVQWNVSEDKICHACRDAIDSVKVRACRGDDPNVGFKVEKGTETKGGYVKVAKDDGEEKWYAELYKPVEDESECDNASQETEILPS